MQEGSGGEDCSLPPGQDRAECGCKVHSFEEDARQEAERKEIMEKKMAQRQKVTDRKKQVQQNLTLLLTALLELKSLATSEESKTLIKEKLDEVRARLDKAKNADSEDDLNTEPNHDISTDMEVSIKGTPLDMKSLGDTFKVNFSSTDLWKGRKALQDSQH
jgi:uncharacterized protein (UPF0305 family)